MSRKIFGKLNFNIEQYPKDNWVKGKQGTYGEVDIIINIDDPHVFSNGNKQYASVMLPQPLDNQDKDRDYLNGWVLSINSVGHSEEQKDGSKKYFRDEEWYKNNRQDTVEDTVDDKGDLPF